MNSSLKLELLWTPSMAAGAALTTVDVLHVLQTLASMRHPHARAGVRWRWWRADGKPLPRLNKDLTSLPPQPFHGLPDVLVLPGWHAPSGPHLDQLVAQSSAASARIQQVHARGGLVLAVGNAAALLGHAGLLNGREAVAPWHFVPAVLRQSEGVRLLTDRPWTVSERVWTCDSPVWTTEIVLDALKQTPWAELAVAASHVLLHSPQRQQVSAQIVHDAHNRKVPPGAVERARRWLEDHATEPYNLPQLAQASATSARTLLRHFSATHGQSPLQYQHSLRMARAQVMLETTYLPVDQIAQACGYTDVGTFRRLFLRATQELPAAYRAHYRLRTLRTRWPG